VTFDGQRVVLDMPRNVEPGNRVHLVWNKPLQLAGAGDMLRVCWDMEIVEDRPNAFYSGLCLGTPEGKRIYVAQSGLKNGDTSMGNPHDLKISGAADDNVDHGRGPLHYDLQVTMEDAATGAVRLELLAFRGEEGLAAEPDAYLQGRTPVARMMGHGTLLAGREFQLFFFVDREDAIGDVYANQARGKIAVSNLFTSAGT
jgi:hypothetical protein